MSRKRAGCRVRASRAQKRYPSRVRRLLLAMVVLALTACGAPALPATDAPHPTEASIEPTGGAGEPEVTETAVVLPGTTVVASTLSPSPTPWRAGTPTPAPTVVLETSEGAALSRSVTLGELSVEYPVRMNAGTSDVVVLQVYLPAMLASLSPLEVERVEVPEDAPSVRGTLNHYTTTIMIGDMMRIELHSLTFEIDALYPATQQVDVDEINRATIWSWEIKAPGTAGSHVVTLRAYVGDDARPVWVRSLAIDVVDETALPGTAGKAQPEPKGAPPLGWIVAAVLAVAVVSGMSFVVARRSRSAIPPLPLDRTGDLAAERRLLLSAFGAAELRRLCQDDARLRPILYDLDEEPSPNEVVDAALNFCLRHGLLDHLLALVSEQRPTHYGEYTERQTP